jgi:hypothetical protein
MSQTDGKALNCIRTSRKDGSAGLTDPGLRLIGRVAGVHLTTRVVNKLVGDWGLKVEVSPL